MSNSRKNKHLTLEDRNYIEQSINEGLSIKQIALYLKKDPTTISKEIKRARYVKPAWATPPDTICINYKHCSYFKAHQCCYKDTSDCKKFEPFKCTRRDRSPGACNGCNQQRKCHWTKYEYSASKAHKSYERTLKECREGFNLTEDEVDKIANIVADPLKKGQSPYAILTNHQNELQICEKTLYTMIEQGVLKEHGITNLTLRTKVSRKITKRKKVTYKKRKCHKHLVNRQYSDYLMYKEECKEKDIEIFEIEMDTVYNDITNGPFIQTFNFVSCHLLFAVLHKEKTASAMLDGIRLLKSILGDETFKKYCHVILTDRGSEFTKAEEIEQGGLCKIFYCDPMCSWQKGSLENFHRMIRFVCPKEKDLHELGLRNQEDLNLIISHINSYPIKRLNGTSPFHLAKEIYHDLYEKLIAFGLMEIDKDEVILHPALIRK